MRSEGRCSEREAEGIRHGEADVPDAFLDLEGRPLCCLLCVVGAARWQRLLQKLEED